MDKESPRTLPARRSIRLRGFDYASNVAYVVNLCSYHRRLLFGTIVDAQLHPSWLGTIVERFRRYIADNPKLWELDRYFARETSW